MADEDANFTVPAEWIHGAVSLDEIEGPDRAPDLIKPVDCPEWRSFKSRIGEGDELRYFTSPPESFLRGGGRMGYVVTRNGEQVACYIVLMS